MDREEWPLLAHADFGAPHCDGCLLPIIRGDQADITCNACAAVVRSVPVADLRRIYDVALGLHGSATETCPHCGHVAVFLCWTSVLAYVCDQCGKPVRLTDIPNMDRVFRPEDQH
jgi:hypothetical protein